MLMFNFGVKIRSLRKLRDLTQEQLAERLGVSFQAVSKWETNIAYPDISMFPIIANYFGVTTDELLGVDISKSQEKINRYLEEQFQLYEQWKLIEMVELARKACHEFPGSFELSLNLAFALHQSYGILTKSNLDEAIDICNKILDESTDTSLRLRATTRLCYCYKSKGDYKKALEHANQLPNIASTRQYLIGRLGLEQGQSQILFSKSCIQLYFDALIEVIEQLIDVSGINDDNKLSYNDKIELYKQILQMQKIVYGDNLCDKHFNAYEYNKIIACFYLLLDSNDKALDYLEQAYKHAEKYMIYSDGDIYTSLMLNGQQSRNHSAWSRSSYEDMIDSLSTDNRYDNIRNEPRFILIMEKLQKGLKS